MSERNREKPAEPVRSQVSEGDDCLDVLIHQHGDEHIDTLAQLISLTSSVENTLAHTPPHR